MGGCAQASGPGWPDLHRSIGRGALGFALAMGGAAAIADIIAGRAPRIVARDFSA